MDGLSGEQGFYAEIDVAPGWRDHGFTATVLRAIRDSYVSFIEKVGVPVNGKLVFFIYNEGVDLVDSVNIPLPVGKEEEAIKLFEQFAETLIGMVKLLVGEDENGN